MVSQCFERAPSRPCWGVAAGAAGVAAAGAELAPELPCCWEDWAKLARGDASMAASAAKRDMVFMVSPWLRLLGEQQSTCRCARQMADSSLFLEADLAQRSLQPVRKLLGIVIRPEVHEEKARLLVQHVAMQRGDFNAVVAQGLEN